MRLSQLDRWLVATLAKQLACALGTPLPRDAVVTYSTFCEVADEVRRCALLAPRARASRRASFDAQIARGRTPEAQHAFVVNALVSFFPSLVLTTLRWLVGALHALRFPVASAMAFGAVPFAAWLVGPAHVEREPSAAEDRAASTSADGAAAPTPPLYSRVVLRKCRYLEAAGCKSACVNICKVPTQAFFADHLGMSCSHPSLALARR